MAFEHAITDGVDAPYWLTFDSIGNLYVGNQGNDTITVYGPGKTQVLETITDGVDLPIALAFQT